MYERFTDRARKTMQLANQEAQRLNHEFIDTGHVLIALLKEGGGVAALCLKKLGVELRPLRDEFEKLISAGPELIAQGKVPHCRSTKKAIEAAMEISREFKHNYVGTEHVLLGLCQVPESNAVKMLVNCRVSAEQVRSEVSRLLDGGQDAVAPLLLSDVKVTLIILEGVADLLAKSIRDLRALAELETKGGE